MTLEAPRVPEPGGPEQSFGSLQSCLVEGDPQSEKRARRIKQRAVAISIALQTIALSALILFPLLSRGERLSIHYDAAPLPPYAPIGSHHHAEAPATGRHVRPPCHICPPSTIPPTISYHDSAQSQGTQEIEGEPIAGILEGPGTQGGIVPTVARPTAPLEPDRQPVKQRYKVSELQQMAQLITRVEPIYPPLPKQIHREGRVELHAVIGVDGTISALEVISGDPLFIQSALSAVRQWRYRPTILNGQPIEVDTHITVIYTLDH